MRSTIQSAGIAGRWLWRPLYSNRRKVATGTATVLALMLGYFAVAGDNGLTVYRQKQAEDKDLAARIRALQEENLRLASHVDRLRKDPSAIEHEAREKLHYARPGEVIYTMPEQVSADQQAPLPGEHPATANR